MPDTNYRSVIKRFRAKIARQSLLVAQDVSVELSARVIRRTPIDTTRCVANWESAINTVPQEFDDERRDPAGQASLSRAKEAAASMRLGNAFVIANSAPYVFRLENGWSNQAPAGFRDLAVAEFQRIAQRSIERRARSRS